MTSATSRPPRHLTDHEIARAVAAGRRLGYPLGTLVEVMALTAAPPRAARFMRWADIDREQAVWSPRRHSGEDPPPTIPLVPDALKLLDAVPARDHRYVFAGPSGRASADNARKRATLAKAAGLPDFEFADIWHTLQAELRHLETRETLQEWASLIHTLIAPPPAPEDSSPAAQPTADVPEPDGTTGTPPRGAR